MYVSLDSGLDLLYLKTDFILVQVVVFTKEAILSHCHLILNQIMLSEV